MGHGNRQVEYLSNPRLRHLERMQELADGASAAEQYLGAWEVAWVGDEPWKIDHAIPSGSLW